MGYTPNELKGQIEEHKERRSELNAELKEAEAKAALILFLAEIEEVKEKFLAGDITAVQSKYVVELIKSKPL